MQDVYKKGKIIATVSDEGGAKSPIVGAKVRIYKRPSQVQTEQTISKRRVQKQEYDPRQANLVFDSETNIKGECVYECAFGVYIVEAEAFERLGRDEEVAVNEDCQIRGVSLPLAVGLDLEIIRLTDDCKPTPCDVVTRGQTLIAKANHALPSGQFEFSWNASVPFHPGPDPKEIMLLTSSREGPNFAEATLTSPSGARVSAKGDFIVERGPVQEIGGSVAVTLRRTATAPTSDIAMWAIIRKSTEAISFNNYSRFMDFVLCGIPLPKGEEEAVGTKFDIKFGRLRQRRFLPYNDTDAYRLLKVATEAFLMVNCGTFVANPNFTIPDLNSLLSRLSLDRTLDLGALNDLWVSYLKEVNGSDDGIIPYLALIREKLRDLGRLKSAIFIDDEELGFSEECFGLLRTKLTAPCFLELIWSYWHEEGMLVQTMNALSKRFQNVRNRGDYDPLAMVEIDPLRPLNNLLWGEIQDEHHRLTVIRRAYEYDHHYGLTLYGKAVPAIRGADSRSKFLEAFHNLLHQTSIFFKEDDDTTVIADGFPLLNALREVHFLLAEGAHNQFGDLPSTARQEMLIQQWILARPEFREFLPTRIMVAYPEPWMDRVDAMKKLQGWTDISVREFNALAVFGEQILLSIRFGAWSTVHDSMQAANWARFWRPEIQGYIHSYRAVTGVDMTADLADTKQAAERYIQPSIHLRNRLGAQRQIR